MTGTHLPVNQRAVHHFHARFMSNVAIGPGGQATLVAAQQASSIAFATYTSAVNVASPTQQTVFSSPFAATIADSPKDTISSSLSSASPALSDLVEVSTTVIVTSEVIEATNLLLSSATSSSSSDSSLTSAPTTSAAPTATSLPSTSASYASMDTSMDISSSTTAATPSSLTAAATSSVTTTASTKEPTLYIGIVLGTIIVIACFTALIAWWFRLRTHNRRRKKTVAVPWANRPEFSLSSFTDADSLEKGEPPDAHQRTWEPRGDRDAGEPKRSRSYLQDLTSPVKRRSVPVLGIPSPPAIYPYHAHPPPRYPASYSSSLPSVSPASIGPLQESIAYPLPNYSPSQTNSLQLNRHVHPNPPSVRMQFLTDPEFGTPRESMIKPRYLSLDEGLKVPWNSETPVLTLEPSYISAPSENSPNSPVSLSERHSQAQERASSPDRSASVSQDQGGTWSSNIKANLMYAFNAVAKAAGGAHSDEEYDKLSPLPSRSASRNRKNDLRGGKSTSVPIPESGWVEYLGGELVGKAPTLVGSPTLEETAEGRGIVHLRKSFSKDGSLPFPGTINSASTSYSSSFGAGMELDSNRGNDHEFLPLPSLQPSMDRSRQTSMNSYQSTAALVVRKKNTSIRSTGTMRSSTNGLYRNFESQRRPRYAYGGVMTVGSRRGSVASKAPKLPALPSFSRSKSGSRTSSLSRLSTMRSMKSKRSIITVLTDREEMARKALIERQRKGNAIS
ncbi:hypothetical protein DFJ43DRAFT_1096852 [Lentinula guzmanii]|uniref:Uncharacterized protein n=1 Tax=Lentinula guzmanii TaxID=2804957 RepID=A0AA38MWR2_9AGAR|nr:hypothetical protein DFJ43DRAFT_1096852 [Lentinula guzmanii]